MLSCIRNNIFTGFCHFPGWQAGLRGDFSLSPYQSLPWEIDWHQNGRRNQGLVALPWFEQDLSNYTFKNNPLGGHTPRGGGTEEHNGVDYLFGYWLARAHGVIGPND